MSATSAGPTSRVCLSGDVMDDLGMRFALAIEGEPVLFEYVIHPEQRQIRSLSSSTDQGPHDETPDMQKCRRSHHVPNAE